MISVPLYEFSVAAFDMYLVSYIWDTVAYRLFFNIYYRMNYWITLAFIVTFSFTLSFVCAKIKMVLFKTTKIIRKASRYK